MNARVDAWAPVRVEGEPWPRPADKPLGLRKNFVWTLAGNVVYAGTQWGTLVVLAKLGSAEMVGQFALGLAVCAPIFIFSKLSLRPIQATDARREHRFGHYLALRLVTAPVALLVIAAIVLSVGYRSELAWVVLAVGLAKALESVSDVFYGAFQQGERMDRISKSMIARGFLGLVALILGMLMTGQLVWGVIGLVVAWATVLIAHDVPHAARLLGGVQRRDETAGLSPLTPLWDSRALLGLARLALPLGVATMMLSLNTNIPRYFIERVLGEGDLGVYAALAYLIVAAGAFINALGQAASPRLALLYARRDRPGFSSLLLRLIGIGVGLGIVGLGVALVFGRELLTLVYRSEYGARADVLVWLFGAFIIGSVASFLGYGLTAARRFRIQPILFGASALACTAASFLLVPAYGLKGAVWSYGVSLIVLLLGSALITRSALREVG